MMHKLIVWVTTFHITFQITYTNMNIIHNRKYACDFRDILSAIFFFDSPSTELLLFYYAKVYIVFHSMAPLQLIDILAS